MPLNKDQDILDVVTAINRDLRRDKSFCELLHKMDDETARRVAKFYIEWLTKTLDNHNLTHRASSI